LVDAHQGWSFAWHRDERSCFDSAFHDEWLDMVRQSPEATIFQHPLLVKAWMATRGRTFAVMPAFLMARHANGSRVMIPFCIWPGRLRNGFRRRLIPVGQPNFDYQDPLSTWSDQLAPGWNTFWPALYAFLKQSRMFELFGIMRLSAAKAPMQARPDSAVASPVIDFREWRDVDHFMSGLGGNLRRDTGRRIRRLSETGSLRLKIYAPGEEKFIHEELNRMREAYARAWAGTPSAGVLADPSIVHFYERIANTLLPAGMLHYSVLLAGDRPVSWVYGFLFNHRYHFYKPVYDPDMADYSPGKIHCYYLVEAGFKEGWQYFDFGAGLESYKLQWTTRQTELKECWWYAETWRGRACAWLHETTAGRRKEGAAP